MLTRAVESTCSIKHRRAAQQRCGARPRLWTVTYALAQKPQCSSNRCVSLAWTGFATGSLRLRRVAVAASSSSAEPGAEGQIKGQPKPIPLTFWVISATLVAIMAALATSPQGVAFKDFLVNGPLGRSGFLAAFSLIFLSEIGDKTFFIAALLAMKLGRWISFLGSLASLSVMTLISVGIGAVFSRVPDALRSSLPVGEIAGCLLLAFFGVRALREGLKDSGADSTADEELGEAESAVKKAESRGRVTRTLPVQAFFEVASLIFVAEWGDRSMLATIALGAAQNPLGVAIGAIVGHAAATAIAVVGGAIASRYVSEKTINLVSGALFLLFAAATAFSFF